MAYNIELPDGRSVEVDDSVDQETARRMVMQRFPDQFPDTKGFMPALKSAGQGALADIDTTMSQIAKQFGNDSAADFYTQRSKSNRQGSESNFNPTSLDDIGNAYNDQGLGPAAGKGFDWLKEQAGSMIGRYGPALAVGAVPGVGPALSLGALTGEESGANIKRKQDVSGQTDLSSGDLATSLGLGLVQGAIDKFGFGKMFSGVAAPMAERAAADLVPQVLKGEITKDVAINKLGGRLQYFLSETGANAALGAGMNTAIEGTRRLAAGQPLVDDEALKAYGEGAIGAAAMSPFFGLGVGARARHGAEGQIRDAAKAYDDRVQMAERGQTKGFNDEQAAAARYDPENPNSIDQQFYAAQDAQRAKEQAEQSSRASEFWRQNDARQQQFNDELSQRIRAGVQDEIASRDAAQRNPDAVAAFTENQPDVLGDFRPDMENPISEGRRATDQPVEPPNPMEQPLLAGLEPEQAMDRRATDAPPQPEVSTPATFEGAVFPRAAAMKRIVGLDMGDLDNLRTVNEELRRYRDNVLATGMTEKNAEQYTSMMNRIDEIRDNLKQRIAQLRNSDQGQPSLKLPPGVALGEQRSSFLKAAPGEEPVLGINGVKNENVPAGFGRRAGPDVQAQTGDGNGGRLPAGGRGQQGAADGLPGEQPVGLHGAPEGDLANGLPNNNGEPSQVPGGLAVDSVRGTVRGNPALSSLSPDRLAAIERARAAMQAEDARKASMITADKTKASFSPDDWNQAIAEYEKSKKGENPQDYAPGDDFYSGKVQKDAPISEDMQDVVAFNGDPLAAMARLGKDTQNPLLKQVSEVALAYPHLAPKAVMFDKTLPSDKAGAYDHATNTIHLAEPANERVLAHEYMHAMTSRALEPGAKLTPDQRSAVQNLNSNYNTAKSVASQYGLEGHNGLTNVKEFVAESFTNPDFQKALSNIPLPGKQATKGVNSLWDQFVRAVGKLIGWSKDQDNVLSNTLHETSKLIAASKHNVMGEAAPDTARDYAPASGRIPYDQPDVAAAEHNKGPLEKMVEGADKIKETAKNINSIRDFKDWFREASYVAEQRLFDWRLGVTRHLNRDATYIDADGLRRATATELLAESEYRYNMGQDSLVTGYLGKNSEGAYQVQRDDNANLKKLRESVMALPDELGADKHKVLTNLMANLSYYEREAKGAARGDEEYARPSHVNDAMMAQALNDYKTIPEVKKVVDMIHDMNMHDIDFMESTNLIGKDLANEFRQNKFYIPLDRVIDQENQTTAFKPASGGSFSKTGDKFKGSERQVRDVLDSLIERRMRLADSGIRNDATFHTIEELKADGQYGIKQMPDHTKPAPDGWYKVKVLEEGRPTAYLLNDKNAYLSLRGLMTDAPAMFRALENATAVFRNAIVITPDFVVRNMFKDNTEAWMANFTHKNIASTMAESFGRFARGVNKQDNYDVTHYGLTGNREFTSQMREYDSIIKQFNRSGSAKDKAAGLDTFFSKLWDKANHISSEAEVATRQTIFNAAKERTGSETEAIAAARNLLDFRRRGDMQAITIAKTLIPFFNSNLQGFYKYYRMITHGDTTGMAVDNAVRGLAIKGAYMAAATTAYAAAMQGNEAYQRASQNERDNYWLVPLPGGSMLRVPIPYEVGAAFKTLPEVMFNRASGLSSNQETKTSLVKAFQRTFPQLSLTYWMPQYLKPALEVSMNRDTFFDRPLEREEDLKKEPWVRTNDQTTPMDRGLGAITGLSPIQAQHIIKGYLGTVGMALASASQMASPSGASTPTNRMPVAGSFLTDPNRSRDLDNYYGYKDTLTKVKTTADALKSRGDVQGLKEYLKGETNGKPNTMLYQMAGQLNGVDTQLRTIRQAMQQIDYDNSMNAIQKRQRKDQLRAMQNQIAKQVSPQLRRLMED